MLLMLLLLMLLMLLMRLLSNQHFGNNLFDRGALRDSLQTLLLVPLAGLARPLAFEGDGLDDFDAHHIAF